MTDNRSADQMTCPHCGGTGTLAAKRFELGAKVWWNAGGWVCGYDGRVPAEVVGYSKTGQRVKIKYTPIRSDGTPMQYSYGSRVMPKSLEPRNE